jgi:anti-sigma-K factor RskA
VTCGELKELAALYVLGALDAAEQAACDAHLAQAKHEGCFEALAGASAAMEALGSDLPEIPPGPHVWKGIEQRIGVTVLAPRARWAPLAGWALAAACAAAAIFFWRDRQAKVDEVAELRAGRGVLQGRIAEAETVAVRVGAQRKVCLERLDDLRRDLRQRDEAMALLQLPGTQLFALAPDKDKPYQASAILHTGVKKAYVVATGLVAVPGRDYQMWVIKGKRAIPAGLIRGDDKGRAIGEIDYAKDLPEGVPDAVAVTDERAGGAETPNLPPILAGKPKGG